jgi:trimeric autotransporter adhesin
MRFRASSAFILLMLTLIAVPARAGEPLTAAPADDASVPKGLAPSDWSSIRAAYEAGRHAVHADDAAPGHFVARNPAQQWLTRFDGRGFSTTPNAGDWSWGLELVSYGRGDAQQAINGTACVQTSGGRVEYAWNPALIEWYINDQRGFEHGYTLRERPEGVNGPDGMLHFTLAVRGDLIPSVSDNGRDVAFASATEGVTATALTYNNLKVFDADGVHLAASFQAITTAAGTPALRLTIDDTHARYPITIDPVAQQAYLKASNTGTDDRFGQSVAVSGDTVVVGASHEDSNATGANGDQADNSAGDAGAAYVFVRSGTTWTQQAYLKASNTELRDYFGSNVAVSGDTVVVGASSEDSSATGVNGDQADNSASFAGAAYVFVRSGTIWTQQAYLKASNTDAGDYFGTSVAISGDTVVVGASREDSNATGVNGANNNSATDSGAAYVFVRSGTVWTQQAYLKASNTGVRDGFGRSVAVSGDTIVVGAYGEASNATGVNGNGANNSAPNSGAAYVFVRTGTTWTQQAYLKASNTEVGDDSFGISVAVSGDTVVVGAQQEDSNATGVNGDQADNSASFAGAAYVFVRSGTTWTQQAYLKASNTGGGDDEFIFGDIFGCSVAVSGDTVVVGAFWEDSSATGVNGNQADNSAFGAGAAYVFTGVGP